MTKDEFEKKAEKRWEKLLRWRDCNKVPYGMLWLEKYNEALDWYERKKKKVTKHHE